MKHIKNFESFSPEDMNEGFFRNSPEEKFEKFKADAMKYISSWIRKGYEQPDWNQIKMDAESDKYAGRIGTDQKSMSIVYIPGNNAGFNYGSHSFGGNS